jgi:transcriptional regulator with XRE-family HTH domain
MARSLIGTRIREARRNLRISQKDLANRAGISPSYLNLIEHNRRGIAGRTLNLIAGELSIDAQLLADGADQTLINQLTEALGATPSNSAELDRLEEFIGRFPGWADLVARLYDNSQTQSRDLLLLTDRLNNDPLFSEAIHMMLTSIAAIRSTADILAEGDAVPAPARARFLSNLSTEGQRLSQTATDLLDHLEAPDATDNQSPQNSSQNFWEQHGFYISDIETGAAPTNLLANQEANAKLERQLNEYARLATSMPIEPFLEVAEIAKYDPLFIAARLSKPLTDVLRRMAHLPEDESIPRFGLIEVDNAGGVMFRKQLPTLALPRYSSACALWPLYRCLGHANLPVQALIEMPTGENFLTVSVATARSTGGFGLPPSNTASMLFTPDYSNFTTAPARASLPRIEVGLHCSVCPRADCGTRNQDFILG